MAQPATPQTLQEYFDKVSRLHTSFRVLAFPQTHGDFVYYTPQQILSKADIAAAIYLDQGLQSRNGTDVVTAISARGTIDWVVTFVALTKLGHTVLLLSPALGIEDITRLLTLSHCQTVIHDDLSTDITKLTTISIRKLHYVTSSDLNSSNPQVQPWNDIPHAARQQRSTPALIIHSSGSTGHPKLIPKSQMEVMALLNTPALAGTAANQAFYVASAVYNGIGNMMMLNAFLRRVPTFYDNDTLPFTAQGYKQLLLEARPQKAWFTPYSLELAASTPEGLWGLQCTSEILVVGAVCPQELGDRLTREGVRLSSNFGQQEIATFMSSSDRPANDTDWDYMSPNPLARAHTEMKPLEGVLSEDGAQYYELIVLKSHPLLQARWVNTSPGDGYPDGSFRNGDIFLKHPTEQRWKIVGRMDDQIKIYANDRSSIVNAIVYEQVVLHEVKDLVEEVILFGQGRRKLGLLVLPRSMVDPEKVENAVWRAVEHKVNSKMGTGLDRNMIVVLPGDSKIPRTNKLNFIRPKVYQRFAKQIEDAYT